MPTLTMPGTPVTVNGDIGPSTWDFSEYFAEGSAGYLAPVLNDAISGNWRIRDTISNTIYANGQLTFEPYLYKETITWCSLYWYQSISFTLPKGGFPNPGMAMFVTYAPYNQFLALEIDYTPICWSLTFQMEDGKYDQYNGPGRYPSKIRLPFGVNPSSCILIEDGLFINKNKYSIEVSDE